MTTKDKCALVEGEDFYIEGALFVFTARYHLRRGYCCENNCRHCPFRADDARGEKTNEDVRKTDGRKAVDASQRVS
ncbi:MAG TPA: DUF5522 domain-containing protein [Pyrinomonadaceae bacterium]|nr:DUF5522 domain-containing protein [Pyrinomonadaceae bacterium]